MRSRNPIYDDYRRKRSRQRWLGRVPLVLAGVAVVATVLALGVWALPQLRGRTAQTTLTATPFASASRATSTPNQVAAATSVPVTVLAPTPRAQPTTAPTVIPSAPALTVTAATTVATQNANARGFDVPALQRLMLDLVNADRQANGLSPVAWDESAARAATAHAEDMAAQGYFSHWNTQGWGPDVRYGMAGGTDVVKENVAATWRRFNDGSPAPIDDWQAVIREAEEGLMNSPGHRANILDPHHTHVGIGIAYNAQTGEARIAQEFINRYAIVSPAPRNANADAIDLSGTLVAGAVEPLINVAYEPMPQTLTPDDLNNRMPKTYQSPAEIVDVINPDVQRQQFQARVRLGQSGAGLYHIRVWVKVNGEEVPTADVIVPIGK